MDLFKVCPDCGERQLKAWVIHVAGTVIAVAILAWLFT